MKALVAGLEGTDKEAALEEMRLEQVSRVQALAARRAAREAREEDLAARTVAVDTTAYRSQQDALEELKAREVQQWHEAKDRAQRQKQEEERTVLADLRQKKEEKARKAEAARVAHEEEKARRLRLARRKKPATTAAGSAKQVAELHRHVHHHLHHMYDAETGDERLLVESDAEPQPEEKRFTGPPPDALGAKTKSALLRTELGAAEKGAERVPIYAKKVEATQTLYAKGHKANLQELKKHGKAQQGKRVLAWN